MNLSFNYPVQVAVLLDRLGDPLESLSGLQEKYPTMNRPDYGA